MLQTITKGRSQELDQEIKNIHAWQVSLVKPKNFISEDPKNFIRNMEASFHNLCNSLEQMGVKDPHSLTTFQFYMKIRFFKEKSKNKKPPKTSKRR